MNTLTLLTMCSVFLGFLCIMAAFWGYMRAKPKKVLIALGLAALVFVTVIPVIIALSISAPKL